MVNAHYIATSDSSSLYSTSHLTRKEEQLTIEATNARLEQVIEKVKHLHFDEHSLPPVHIDESFLQKLRYSYHELENEYRSELDSLYHGIAQLQMEIAAKESKCYEIDRMLAFEDERYQKIQMAYERIDIQKITEKIISQDTSQYDKLLIDDLRTLQAEFESLIRKRESFHLPNLEVEIIDFAESIYKFDEMKAKYSYTIQRLENEIAALKSQISHQRNEVLQLKFVDLEHGGMTYKLEIDRIKEELVEEIKKYVALMDLKLYFDSELSIYQKLVASEEARLTIRKQVAHTGRSFVTKARSDIETVFDEISMGGEYIHLTNKGAINNYLGNWKIRAEANGVSREYTLEHDLVLKPGQSVKIYSSKAAGATAKSAENEIVRVMNGNWPSGDRIKANLYDESGKVIARLDAFYDED